jgi:ankyrin repeat protein
MNRAAVAALACFLLPACAQQAPAPPAKPVSFNYDQAYHHELKPHRRAIPLEGENGFNQLRITLIVSPIGEVISAETDDDAESQKRSSQVKDEIVGWKFEPFVVDGKPVLAKIEEYIDLIPPERFPKTRVVPPSLRPDSRITIALDRSGCFGSCPSYSVSVSPKGIVFDGGGYVAAKGKHIASVDPDAVRKLAARFIVADFYSMADGYAAPVTDNPGYTLSIDIDGHKKEVHDYVGQEVGMPAAIKDLEDSVDELAETKRWIKGEASLVQTLQDESYNFKTFDAQVILKEAATRGEIATVQALLEAGVPLQPIAAPKPKDAYEGVPFEYAGWLTAAASHPETLKIFIDADASKDDQSDKDLALVGAARSGKVEAVRALIAYGANPNADLRKLVVTEEDGGMALEGYGAGSTLIYAASSGNPETVKEILQYHPSLDARDSEGRTVLFAAGKPHGDEDESQEVECVRLLVEAGADVNARDKDGNTPLHEIYLTTVEEELLKLGADVNARNKDGETPIFTTYDDAAIPLLIRHGADLSIRNNKAQSVFDAAEQRGPQRVEALRAAMGITKSNNPAPSPDPQ